MQPWDAFRPDGVIMFSDILTPLPALGIEFDVIRGKGPIILEPIRRCALLPASCGTTFSARLQSFLADLILQLDGYPLIIPNEGVLI